MAFDRDLGYLDKFFDNLDAHASTLGDVQGARLKTLVGEERQRWGEIRSLVGGPSSGGEKKDDKKPSGGEEKTSAPAAKPDTAAPKLAETAAPAAALTAGAPSGAKGDVTASATRVPVSGFTVGSLRGGR